MFFVISAETLISSETFCFNISSGTFSRLSLDWIIGLHILRARAYCSSYKIYICFLTHFNNASFSILPSAVKLVESIKSNSRPTLSDTLPLPTKYERLLRLFDYTEVASHFLKEIFRRMSKLKRRPVLHLAKS